MTSRACLIGRPLFVLTACGSPPAPSGSESITGGERFGWDQPAADAGELTSFRYALYVGDARSEAVDVSCAPGQTSGLFGCSSRLPAMSSGAHTLQVASFVNDGGAVRERTRSTAVPIVKRRQALI